MEDFIVEKKLAQGGQGSTMLVRRKVPTPEQNQTMVLKQSKCENLKAANNALKEAKVLQRLQHAHIVCFLDVFLHEEDKFLVICMLMEYCDRGDLGCYMNKVRSETSRISEKGVLRWTREMTTALDYLHQQQIIHRDIKPLNVFLTHDGHIKLGDFGLASSTKNDKNLSKVGTPSYLAPEVIQNEEYGFAIDMWGVGCVVWEMMTFEFLWERKGMLSVQVLSRPISPFDFPQDYSQALRDLAVSMLDKDPAQRPSPGKVSKTCALLRTSGSSSRLLPPDASPLAGFHDLAQGLAGHVEAFLRPPSADSTPEKAPQRQPPPPADQRPPPRVPGTDGGAKALVEGVGGPVKRQTPAQTAGRPRAPDTQAAVGSGSPAQAPSGRVGVRRRGAAASVGREERFGQQKAVRAMLEVRGLRRYVAKFEEHELYGEELSTVTDADLEHDMGVANPAHRAALLKALRDILSGVPPSQIPPPPPPDPSPRHGTRTENEAGTGSGEGSPSGRQRPPSGVRREGSVNGGGASEVSRWLLDQGFGEWQNCFEANGVRKLKEMAALSRTQLIAMGIPDKPSGGNLPVVTLLEEALNNLKPARRPSPEEHEEAMVQAAIQESLAEYESSISSSPAPSTPASGSQHPASGSQHPTSGSQPPSWHAGNGSQPGSRPSAGPGSDATAATRARREKEKRESETRGAETSVLRGMVSIGSLDGRGWRMAYCRLENNRLRVWWGDAVPEAGHIPDEELSAMTALAWQVVMDGMCVDVAEGREGCVFIRRSMHVKTDGDRLLAMRNVDQFTQWLQRLQASAYFTLVPGASSLHSRVQGLVMHTLEIINASALFKDMSLVVNVARTSGELLYTIKEMPLPPPAEKARMRFDLWLELPVPTEADAAMFFEVRHVKGNKAPTTKYWTTLACADMQQGARALTVYKAPCEYDVARQKLQPKQSSRLDITLTA